MASTSTPTRHRTALSVDVQKTPRPSALAASTPVVRSISDGAAAAAAAGGTKGSNTRSAAKDLLRDYYGLNKAGGSALDAKNSSKSAGPTADPLNIDSPSFSAQAYIQNLLSTATLAQLLQASTELSNSISDLEGERQSLVYNHHHELIDASVTISKMKVRAESLDTTLEQLKAGLSRCSELNNGLRLPVDNDSNSTSTTTSTSEDRDETATTTIPPRIDWQSALGTIVDLPFVMRNATHEEAQRLWGTYEPVLRQWKDAGVKDIDEIEAECRQCLNGNS